MAVINAKGGAATPVPLRDVERELGRRLKAVQGPGESPVVRACMANLLIYCSGDQALETVEREIPNIVALHPSRVLLLHVTPGTEAGELTSAVRVRGKVVDPGRWVVSEEVTLRATGLAVARLPSAVRGLLIGDLPTSMWWAVPQPPPLAGDLFFDLAEQADQVIYDSIGWPEPARGVVTTAAWLGKFDRGPGQGKWRVASDLNWRRLKYWRRLLMQALDPATAPGALDSITEITLEHGPHAVIQAWELVSWLASRLRWSVRDGKLEPGVELTWQFAAGQKSVQVSIRRLDQGPPAIRSLRVICLKEHKTTALNLKVVDNERRLIVCPDQIGAAPRTVTVPLIPLAELIGQQLADRARDLVFRESMDLAGILAQSVLNSIRK